jgi:SH3 domain-containing protein
MRTTKPIARPKPSRYEARAAILGVLLVVLMLPVTVYGQRGRGQGRGADAQPPKPTGEMVRVKTAHANIHTGPTSGNEVLVLAAKGTVLPVLARRGEWIQVSLSPELRKSGMVMRWYKNENNGWIHDSMIEVAKTASK